MRALAMLCTYNEAAALPQVLIQLRRAVPGIEILVVDDDSPDGTARAAKDGGAAVLLRSGRPRGRGYAGREGYAQALSIGADVILEMDADGSHDPADAPRLLEALKTADVAVGSRAGGKDDRGILRRAVSAAAKSALKLMLELPLEDPTSGYRAFRREALLRIDPGTLAAAGPEIVEEVYLRAARANLKMVEVPIVFRNRSGGSSKLTPAKLIRVFWRCLRMSRTPSVTP